MQQFWHIVPWLNLSISFLLHSPYYVIFEEMQDSIRMLGIIPEENIITINSKSLSSLVLSTLKMLVTLRRKKVDAGS